MLRDAQDGAEVLSKGQGAEDTAWPQSSSDSDPIRQDVNVRNGILLLPCSCPDTKSLVADFEIELVFEVFDAKNRFGLAWQYNLVL